MNAIRGFRIEPRIGSSFGLRGGIAALLLASCAGAFAAGEPQSAKTQIYQQRTADGRILLTDRPSPTAVTERAWQMDAESPAVTHQRALEAKAEAQAVSERVQRTLDRQQKASDDAWMRDRLARADADRQRAGDLSGDDDVYGGGVFFSPYLLRGSSYRGGGRGRFDDRRSGNRPPHAAPRLRGSATLGSR